MTDIFCVFQLVPLLFILLSSLSSHTCALMLLTHLCINPQTAQDVITPCSSHTCFTDPNSLYCGKPSEVVPSFPLGNGAVWLIETMTLFSGLGTDVHFSGDEQGLQWGDYLFELKNAVEKRMAMSRGRNMCSGMTNRVLIDDGARWTLQGGTRDSSSWGQSSPQHAGGDYFWPCKRARETGLSERNGMIAFGRIRERFGKTAGVANLSDVLYLLPLPSPPFQSSSLRTF